MLELGRRMWTKMVYMPKTVLVDSVPGRTYELHIRTRGIVDERKAAETVVYGLMKRFGVSTNWIKVEESTIKIQIQGSPFPWALVLAFLPEILVGIGIIVVLISVFFLEGALELGGIMFGILIMLSSLAAGYVIRKAVTYEWAKGGVRT